jgi:transcriptional regulator with XRE-family HTH domain
VAAYHQSSRQKEERNVAMQRRNSPSPAGQFLRNYRKKYNLTQEQLAEDIKIEPRTLRSYESGERPLNNINELHRIADTLGVEPEQLGLAAAIYVPRDPEEIENVISHTWELVEESRLVEARNVIERLAQNLRNQVTTADPKLLQSLARTYHTAGYVVSEATKSHESYEAILYYQQMETAARAINDQTLLNIALTYQGDMYRRLGNLEKAITYLEAARDTTPNADKAAKGNGIQLLARVYFRKGELDNFERAMGKAEELSYEFDPSASSTQGHYNPGTVYEDYGRSYADLGQIYKAMAYLDRAEETLPKTKFWELLMMTSRAMALVKGNELQSGIQLAIEAAEQSRAAGILRYLDRIHTIDQYLEKLERQIGKSRRPLHETLQGGQIIDY